jgi:hypothetical protein
MLPSSVAVLPRIVFFPLFLHAHNTSQSLGCPFLCYIRKFSFHIAVVHTFTMEQWQRELHDVIQQQLQDLDKEYKDQMVFDLAMQLDTTTFVLEPRKRERS